MPADVLADRLRQYFDVPIAHATNSGRWALALLLRALDNAPEDEVLLQAYTCVSVPGPVLWAGLRPVYVDIHPTTCTMDPADLRRKITPRSRVLIIQHTFGTPAHLDELLAVAREHRLVVIEDCAHALGARYRGKLVGSFGDAAVLSFGRDKAISGVFGGALLVARPARFTGLQRELHTLEDPSVLWTLQQLLHPILFVTLIRPLYFVLDIGKALLVLFQRVSVLSKAIVPREKRGETPAFPAARLPGPLASLVLSQFDRHARFNERRRLLARVYEEELAGLPVILPTVPEGGESIYLRYTIQVPHPDDVRRFARRRRILLGDWYDTVVAPRRTDLRAVGYREGSCPVAERVATRSLNVPTNPYLTDGDARRVVDAIRPLLESSPLRVDVENP